MTSRPQATSDRLGALRLAGRAIAILIAVAFVGLLVWAVTTKAPSKSIDEHLAQGKAIAAPRFTLDVLQPGRLPPNLKATVGKALAGRRLSLAELRGSPVVLNFWASWCVPCRQEAPLLERAWQRARRRGVVFLGLNMQDVTDDARSFMHSFGTDYPNVRDPSNGVARRYGLTGIPETYFIGAAGQVVGHVVGVVSDQQLQQGIAAALAGRPEPKRRGGARRATR